MGGKAVPDHNWAPHCDAAWERIDTASRILISTPWFRQLIIHLSSLRPDFIPRPVSVAFKVAVRLVFLQFSHVSNVTNTPHSLLSVVGTVYYLTVDSMFSNIPRIPNLGIRWRWVDIPTPQLFHPVGKSPHYPLNMWALCQRGAFFFLIWHNSPQWARASLFTRFLNHAQRHTTVSRTQLDELLACCRDPCLTTHNTHDTSIPLVWFQPTISAGERSQTFALDHTVSGTGRWVLQGRQK
jgi:hypothetical protein